MCTNVCMHAACGTSNHLVCCQYCRFYNASALVATITHFYSRGGNLVMVLAAGAGGCCRPNGWQHLSAMVQIRVKSLLTGIAVATASTSTSISTFFEHFIVIGHRSSLLLLSPSSLTLTLSLPLFFRGWLSFPTHVVIAVGNHFPISLARLLDKVLLLSLALFWRFCRNF